MTTDRAALKCLAIQALGGDLKPWAQRCHEASLEIVRSGLLPPCRVARGACNGVGGQHSWVVVGENVYAPNATIVDATLWSYNAKVKGVWVGEPTTHKHNPKGSGSIWTAGRPPYPQDAPMELTPKQPWSDLARDFLEVLGPLDLNGWVVLAHLPVGGWPAKEIITAMAQDRRLFGKLPIDVVGNLTDLNPSGLYR